MALCREQILPDLLGHVHAFGNGPAGAEYGREVLQDYECFTNWIDVDH